MHEVKVYKDKIEWLNNRGIGGSSASAIVGLSPYKTNVELWESFIKEEKIETEEQNEIQEYGSKAEKPIKELFELEHPQYKLRLPKDNEIELLINEKYDFITGTLDGELTEIETGRKGILEIKTQLLNSYNVAKWNNHIPDNYYCQLLHYFILDDEFEFAIIHCRQRKQHQNGNVEIREIEYKIERSECLNDIKYLLKAEIDFWECVKTKTKPALLLNI